MNTIPAAFSTAASGSEIEGGPDLPFFSPDQLFIGVQPWPGMNSRLPGSAVLHPAIASAASNARSTQNRNIAPS
jgi:hypothetical protein